MRRDHHYLIWALVVAGSVLLSGCVSATKGRAEFDIGMKERGIASWYGDDFHGWVSASGELYDMHALTGAHRTLPLGTVARITNVVNGKHVVIRINDRGPYVNGRILDVSYAAAKQLGMLEVGISAIQLEAVGQNRFDTGMSESHTRMGGGLGVLDRALDAVPTLQIICESQPHHAMVRMMPTDILRERRARGVGDVMAADRRVKVVAQLELV